MSDDSRSPLSVHTTLGLGGPARRLTTVTSVDEIVSGVRECVRDEQPLLLLGGGSNVVIADDGFPGTVLLIRSQGWDVTPDDDHVSVTVQAGHPWDALWASLATAMLVVGLNLLADGLSEETNKYR